MKVLVFLSLALSLSNSVRNATNRQHSKVGNDYFLEDVIPLAKPLISKMVASFIYNACWGPDIQKKRGGDGTFDGIITLMEDVVKGTCTG